MQTKAVIFDFDDTLVYSYPGFQKAEENFVQTLCEIGLSDRSSILNYLHEADIRNVQKAGYFAGYCFPEAVKETYRYFCGQTGIALDFELEKRIVQSAWDVFKAEIELIDGAASLLEALSVYMPLFLLTQGEQEIQRDRLKRSGLGKYFKTSYFVHNKTAGVLNDIIEKEHLDAKNSWMIGNSLRFDIAPALVMGMNIIHYTNSNEWIYDKANVNGEYHTVYDLQRIKELIL